MLTSRLSDVSENWNAPFVAHGGVFVAVDRAVEVNTEETLGNQGKTAQLS
jgi:hypothetical protein